MTEGLSISALERANRPRHLNQLRQKRLTRARTKTHTGW